MGQLRELVSGDGSLDTALRALALALFVAVATAIIFTALTVGGLAAAMEPATKATPIERTDAVPFKEPLQ